MQVVNLTVLKGFSWMGLVLGGALLSQSALAVDHYERKFTLLGSHTDQLLIAESEQATLPLSDLGDLVHKLLNGGANLQKQVDDLAPSTGSEGKARADRFCQKQPGYTDSARYETVEPQFLAPTQKDLLRSQLQEALQHLSKVHSNDTRLKFEVPISLFSEVTCRGDVRSVISAYMKDPVRISKEYQKVHGSFEYQQGVPHYFGGGYEQVSKDPYFQRILNRLLVEDHVELVAGRDVMRTCIGWVCSWF